VRNALDLARRVEAAWLPFLSPSWWRMRAFLRRAYDFDVHAVRPSWTRILEDLAAENQQRAALAEVEEAVRGQFGIEGSIASFAEGLAEARRFVVVAPDVARRCHHVLLGRPDAGAVLRRLFELEPLSAELAIVLGRFLERARTLSFARLDEVLDAVEGSLSELDDFLCCLTEVVALPPALAGVLRRAPCTLPALECSILARSISRALEGQRAVKRYRARTRARQMARVGETFRHWQRWNARVVRRRVEQRFRENVRQASLPASQLAGEEREAKNVYNRGRRALEHEFGKTMRFRSIRDLLAGDSGCVIRDLKPVWLMSPLSVADSLPLAADQFDAVIFDEASQITVEEAVPCLFRAPHFIVVGDRMQLPPTNFFSSRQVDAEGGAGGDAEEEIPEYDLDSHSFLHQVSQKLPSTMLGWHYRSRSEALISFSNAAFYRGELLTVPQRRRLGSQWGPIAVESPEEDAAAHVGALLERPISFHYLPGGVYQKRRNRDEARYIAGLVRELLRGEHGLSLAVVAFSQPQQSEIELALDELAREDAAFARRLETEFEREEEDQHRGLLVKNLENVQGDERDVVILSVCYGYDARRKMRMHFGPINQRGGEKRLNVAFSRARRHMVVVSSIRHGDITNDYNDGAGCLKNYLRYAEQVSCGAAEEAADVLREMSLRERRGAGRAEDTDEVVASIGAALRERGYLVDTAVGQSHFRCDLAVRVEGEQAYRVAILVDTDSYYAESDIIQRDLLKPRLLREAGWNVVGVFTRDWLDDRERVLKDIEQALARGEPVGRAKPREPV
jgi:hypothetical protein